MEHESFVPVPPARLAAALRTPAAVAAALPGWQPDPGTEQDAPTAAGRLRLRVAGSTITYRGHLAVEGEDSPFGLVARGTEIRGDGMVAVTASVTLADTTRPEPGTAVGYEGTAEVTGRLASYDPDVVEAAVRRLLDRFAAGLAEQAERIAGSAEQEHGEAPGETTAGEESTEESTGESAEAPPEGARPSAQRTQPDAPLGPTPGPPTALPAQSPQPDAGNGPAEESEPAEEPAGTDAAATAEPEESEDQQPEPNEQAERPAGTSDRPPAEDQPGTNDGPRAPDETDASEEPDIVDDLGDASAELEEFELVEVELEVPESAAALDDLVPPAEAAHARRTMIGRSAEEVDHAPPRGRYAPAPAPDSSSAVATLRWAAPAAAALLASAVVVGRVLRRRR